LYTFIARDENDVSVERGEFVTVLNREDPDWYWVVRSDGQEGFVPSAFVYPAEAIQSNILTFVILFFICSFANVAYSVLSVANYLHNIFLYLWWYGFYR
jgi:Variant SH3 domain